MITCDLFGGLGNNLFQLATVYAIHKKYGFNLVLPNFVARGNIGIYGQSTTLEFGELFDNFFVYDQYASQILPKYIHTDHVPPSQTDFTYSEIPVQDNVCYHGYFQSDKYFQGIDLTKHLKINYKRIEDIKTKFSNLFTKKIISLHYRLAGDRINNHMQHYHKDVSIDYYKKVLESINNIDEYNILVFSDNIEKAKTLLSQLDHNFIYIEGTDNITDFIFMTLCDINIVGNSTFSWWAAYMNTNPNKIVFVTESEWFGPGYKHFNLKDAFPETWIRL